MMIPSVCIIMIATFRIINQIYTDKYISNIEDESKYADGELVCDRNVVELDLSEPE